MPRGLVFALVGFVIWLTIMIGATESAIREYKKLPGVSEEAEEYIMMFPIMNWWIHTRRFLKRMIWKYL